MKIEKADYSNRVVAFIDILGFGEIVNSSVKEDKSTNQKGLSLIFDAMKILHTTWEDMFNLGKKKDVTLFSDSAIISFPIEEPSEVFFTLLELLHLTMGLLQIGVLIRGGISVGKCFHNQSTVFGPAVNRAVKMEQIANFPRIIIDPNVILAGISNHASHHTSSEESEYLEKLYKKDIDERLYLDYFDAARTETSNEFEQFKYIHHLYNLITKNKDYYHDNEKIFRKYVWMQKKYNEMVEPMINKQEIELALKHDPIIAQELQSLKLIS